MQYKIGDIANIIGAERHGSTDALVNWLLIDSRSLCFPEETLFFALKTKRNDGLKYISELHNRGVRNFVVNHIPEVARLMQDCNFLVVRDTLEALQRLAAYHRAKFDMPVVAITGSKPTTYVLQPGDNIYTVAKRFNVTVEGLLNTNRRLAPEQYVEGQTVHVTPNTALPFYCETASVRFDLYKVQDGESFYAIARKHGISQDDLQAANPDVKKPKKGDNEDEEP